MITGDLTFKIFDVVLQLGLLTCAIFALFTWKSEIRGKERYRFAKELLDYIKEIAFIVHHKDGSLHQIYLNDIFDNRESFYDVQLKLIGKSHVYFSTNSFWQLLPDVQTRNDLFLPKTIRDMIDEIKPGSSKWVDDPDVYIQIRTPKTRDPKAEPTLNKSQEFCQPYGFESLTIEEYFRRWEKLIKALRRYT
jgi:hypothetical protein